jgi:hypothetical protein
MSPEWEVSPPKPNALIKSDEERCLTGIREHEAHCRVGERDDERVVRVRPAAVSRFKPAIRIVALQLELPMAENYANITSD